MTDQPNTPPTQPSGRSTAAKVLMIIIGIVLLLPGLCAIVFAGGMMLSGPGGIVRDGTLMGLWVICLAISAGGIALIRIARR